MAFVRASKLYSKVLEWISFYSDITVSEILNSRTKDPKVIYKELAYYLLVEAGNTPQVVADEIGMKKSGVYDGYREAKKIIELEENTAYLSVYNKVKAKMFEFLEGKENNYKFIVIGDIHGSDIWKKILEIEKKYDKVIFLGDYFDSHAGYEPAEDKQLSNFQEIMKLDKCIRLLGNHDLSYYNTDFSCSEFTPHKYGLFNKPLHKAIEDGKLDIIFLYNQLLFSHAGVSKEWIDTYWKKRKIEDLKMDVGFDMTILEFHNSWNADPFGNDKFQSPLWIRPVALSQNMYKEYTQIIAHTPTKGNKIVHSDDEKIWICDTLPNEYLVIENDKFIPKEIKE